MSALGKPAAHLPLVKWDGRADGRINVQGPAWVHSLIWRPQDKGGPGSTQTVQHPPHKLAQQLFPSSSPHACTHSSSLSQENSLSCHRSGIKKNALNKN